MLQMHILKFVKFYDICKILINKSSKIKWLCVRRVRGLVEQLVAGIPVA